MLLSAITSVLNAISPAFTIFISSSLTSKARFCFILFAKALIRACRFIKGGAPEATCKLVLFFILKTSLMSLIKSNFPA
jgi:hypothetical protein